MFERKLHCAGLVERGVRRECEALKKMLVPTLRCDAELRSVHLAAGEDGQAGRDGVEPCEGAFAELEKGTVGVGESDADAAFHRA